MRIFLVLTLVVFSIFYLANLGFASTGSSNLSIANLSKAIVISPPLHANNTTYIFSNLNISINITLPKSAISTAPTPSNANSVNTECNTKMVFSQIPVINSSTNINNINQSFSNLTSSQTVFSSPSYNATVPAYTYNFSYRPENKGFYDIQSSCLTENISYEYNSITQAYSIENVTSISMSALAFRYFRVYATPQNVSQYLQPFFNKTVTIRPNVTIINKTGKGDIISQLISINSSSQTNEQVHISVSNATGPNLGGFNYTNSFIYSFNASTTQNLSIYFESTYMLSRDVQVDILNNNAWYPISFNYTGSDYLTLPLMQGTIGIFINAPSSLLNLTHSLNSTSNVIIANAINTTITQPINITNISNVTINNITNVSNITAPATTNVSNVSNITTKSHKITKKGNAAGWIAVVIIILIAATAYYYYRIRKKSRAVNKT